MHFAPTPFFDANEVVRELTQGVKSVLGPQFIGMYLEGSLANGGFDRDSDIDFVVVTADEISAELFGALQSMHDRIAGFDSPWAIQLEGSYIPKQAIRRYDPATDRHPNIERGPGERLKWLTLERVWDIHRYITRERGIVLAGPSPQSLVDPVTPGDLREAMVDLARSWAATVLQDPAPLAVRGHQSYLVLSACRMLYTLEHSEIVSKQAAAVWARRSLDSKGKGVIARALTGRHSQYPATAASPEDIAGTLDFIRLAVARSEAFESGDLESPGKPPR